MEKRQNDLKSEELNNSYKFVADYYLHQNIINEGSVEEFVNVMKIPLNNIFYISTYSKHAKRIKQTLKSMLNSVKIQDIFTISPTPHLWFINECMWSWKYKDFIPYEECHIELRKFLHQQEACGNIIKQDVLDMLPVSLLDVDETQKVLDMSGHSNHKFHQLADLLRLQDQVDADNLFVVVESDQKKCLRMSDMFSRHASPRLAVINVDAKTLPLMSFVSCEGTDCFLAFDRVLCFFPSSNDGLIRNNPETVRGWTWSASLSHHGNLCEMLNSGLGVLKIGGRLVYAINSMNPVEGEAVISTVLYQQKGSVKLIDVSSELPDIKYDKGLSKWEVLTNQKWYSNADEVPQYLWSQVWTSMFPLPPEITEQQHLDRCIRILPHKQNTSGMFVGVLTRVEYLEQAIKREEEEAKKKWEEEEALRIKKKEEEVRASEEKKRRKQERKKRKLELKEARSKEKAQQELTVSSEEQSCDQGPTSEKTCATERDGGQKDKILSDAVAEDGKLTVDGIVDQTSQTEVKDSLDDSIADGSIVVNDDVNISTDVLEKKGEQEVRMAGECARSEEKNKNETNGVPEEDKEAGSDYDYNFAEERTSNIEHISDVPITCLDPQNPFLYEIKTFYGLSSEFPQHLLYVKMFEDVPFYCYFVSNTLDKILRSNMKKQKFVGVGVKVFAYMDQEDVDCRLRITQEGAKYILPYMNKQVVQTAKKDLIAILSKPDIELYNLSSSLQNKISRMGRGSFVITYEPTTDDGLDEQLVLSCLKTNNIYKCFLSEYQRFFYLRQLGVPFSNYDDSKVTLKEALLNFANHFKNATA